MQSRSQDSQRYAVEVNVDHLADAPECGEWEAFTAHKKLIDALRACSVFMAIAKEQVGVDLLDRGLDDTLEPRIRIYDRWNNEAVVWVDETGLQTTASAAELAA